MDAAAINTERLVLEPLGLKFLSQDYVNWLNDPIVNAFIVSRESGEEYTIEALEDYLSDVEKKNILFWAISLKGTGKHIGNIKIDPVSPKHGTGDYGILMGDRNEWNKGYAREASEAVIQYCFNELGIRKITLAVAVENEAAVALYKKIGFIEEGLHRHHHKISDGVYSDCLRMAIFNPSFKY